MANERKDPYGNFNFLIDLGTGDTENIRGGFQEVTGLNIEVTKSEYRSGNDRVGHMRKYASLYKVGDITCKRGLMGALDLYNWIDLVRKGDQTAKKQSISIHLRDESGNTNVMTWKLTNAWPTKYSSTALNAKTGTDVAIEELVITYEDLTIE